MSGSLLDRLSPAPVPIPTLTLSTSPGKSSQSPRRQHHKPRPIPAANAEPLPLPIPSSSSARSRWADPPSRTATPTTGSVSPVKSSLLSRPVVTAPVVLEDVAVILGELELAESKPSLSPVKKRGENRSRWDTEVELSIAVEDIVEPQVEPPRNLASSSSPIQLPVSPRPTHATPQQHASPSKSINWADDDDNDDELPELDEDWGTIVEPFSYNRPAQSTPVYSTPPPQSRLPAATPPIRILAPPPRSIPTGPRHLPPHLKGSPVRKDLIPSPPVRNNYTNAIHHHLNHAPSPPVVKKSSPSPIVSKPTQVPKPPQRRQFVDPPSTVFARLSGISSSAATSNAGTTGWRETRAGPH